MSVLVVLQHILTGALVGRLASLRNFPSLPDFTLQVNAVLAPERQLRKPPSGSRLILLRP